MKKDSPNVSFIVQGIGGNNPAVALLEFIKAQNELGAKIDVDEQSFIAAAALFAEEEVEVPTGTIATDLLTGINELTPETHVVVLTGGRLKLMSKAEWEDFKSRP